ncbi:glycosyltransferase [Acetobacteroides hydrogenigenes]|uniref:Glycosyltransferase involved in cell wall biosynthesis n=1 Tax=Acetobacteroides hydrogenigenes TaxID=979970 RepID=A0A4R2E8U9_9BACT|nr:glycosyltransferase [Acetobacteroides hydrogenigenes]TCN62204.1 glycosyltransferase involved in cell wall biosynthesis [Acetobacteroides hydrogenigenes]
MKILLLADASASHIINWANSLSNQGCEIDVFSFTYVSPEKYSENVRIFNCNIKKAKTNIKGFNLYKLSYAFFLWKLYRLLILNKYDIIHAHYATSYGFVLSLLRHKRKILSFWGSDVFTFPKKSIFHKYILKHNIKSADIILSTSNSMKLELHKYTNKDVFVTPFGINTQRFCMKNVRKIDAEYVVGTVKFIEKTYGTDYLIKMFNILKYRNPTKNIKLLIVGGYNDENFYNEILELISSSNYKKDIILTGVVDYEYVVDYYNSLDVFITLSRQESFGVSALEAQSCGIPVVVSTVGGLPEVVKDGVTGYIVDNCNVEEAAKKVEDLLFNPNKALLKEKCREFVAQKYNWNISVENMIKIYNDIYEDL